METAVKNPYSVKGVKSFMGMEGYGYECSLYKDGKRIGTVTDVADGGGMLQCNLKDGEEEALEAYCKTLPSETSEEYDLTIDIDPCIFMSRLVDAFENDKRYKRLCKNKTVYTLKDNPESLWSINIPFNELTEQKLKEKHGDNLKEIINKRYI